MAVPDWISSSDWDDLYLAGAKMPGVARVSISLPTGVDVKKPKGGRRAKLRDCGAPPCKIRIQLELMPDELPEFEAEVVPLLRPRAADGLSDPVEIAHPNARLWGVHVIVVEEVDAPHPDAGDSLKVSFNAREWAPQPTKVGKGTDKPKDDGSDDWNVQPLIDRLRPKRAGAAAANF